MFWTIKLILSDRSNMKEVATDFISENHLKNGLHELSFALYAHNNHDSDKSNMK